MFSLRPTTHRQLSECIDNALRLLKCSPAHHHNSSASSHPVYTPFTYSDFNCWNCSRVPAINGMPFIKLGLSIDYNQASVVWGNKLNVVFYPSYLAFFNILLVRYYSEYCGYGFRAVSEQFRSRFRAVSEQFQSSFRAVFLWFSYGKSCNAKSRFNLKRSWE